MIIRWLGHAAFLLETQKGVRIITDPFEPGSYSGAVGYPEIKEKADIVSISHNHPDHSWMKVPGKPKYIKAPGTYPLEGLTVVGFQTHHDRHGGKDRGDNVLFRYDIDKIRIVHTGDLGHLLDDELREKIGRIDIVMMPVGGLYTLGPEEQEDFIRSITPRVVIPMHYKTDYVDFPIEDAERFLKTKERVFRLTVNEYEIYSNLLPKECTYVIFPPEFSGE
jgi:L-ascorbate metabolism protein UlaG (beta-lactamase superfamily)